MIDQLFYFYLRRVISCFYFPPLSHDFNFLHPEVTHLLNIVLRTQIWTENNRIFLVKGDIRSCRFSVIVQVFEVSILASFDNQMIETENLLTN